MGCGARMGCCSISVPHPYSRPVAGVSEHAVDSQPTFVAPHAHSSIHSLIRLERWCVPDNINLSIDPLLAIIFRSFFLSPSLSLSFFLSISLSVSFFLAFHPPLCLFLSLSQLSRYLTHFHNWLKILYCHNNSKI